MNEHDYLAERRLFWSDLLMSCVIVGGFTVGVVLGAWLAIQSLLGSVA